jgi:hypothetical protein
MICDEDDHGSNYCDQDAPQVHSRNAHIAKRVKNRATDNRSNDSQEQISHQPFASPVHELASDVAGDQPYNQP